VKIENNQQNIHFKGIYTNKIIKRGLEFAADNGALFAAGTSLTLSTVARPIAILSTPNTDKENKQYACVKSLSSSLIGYLLMLGASLPVSRAIKNISENPADFLKSSTIKNLKGNEEKLTKSSKYIFATQLFKLGLGLLVVIPKSIMISNLIPPMMKKIFPKQQDDNMPAIKSANDVSFKGSSLNPLSKQIGKVIDTDFIQKMSEKFHQTNFAMHIMSLTDILGTAAFIHCTNKNKDIKEDRKKTLIYNSAIATGLSVSRGYILDRALKKPTERFIEKFKAANKNSPKLDKYVEGIKVAKPILILGGTYYIIIPFISTFLADRVGKNKQSAKKVN